MKIYKELKQGTEEWLQVRAGKLTGSDFHEFLSNFGKEKVSDTVKLKLLRKASEIITGKLEEGGYKNANMERGNELEEEARINYQEYSFNVVEQVGFIELNERIGCSPDGLIGKDGLIEIKCPLASTFLNHFIKGEKAIKPMYHTQMQFNMYVSDRKYCEYICFHPEFKTRLYVKRIERDEEYIEKIKACIEENTIEIDKIIKSYKDKK